MVKYKKYSDIEIFEGKISKHEYPWHFHPCYTIIIVDKGSIQYEFQDHSINVDNTEVLLVEPFEVHRNVISQPTMYKAIFVPKEYFECEGVTKIKTQTVYQPHVIERLLDLYHKIESNQSRVAITDCIFKICEFLNQLPIENNNPSPANSNMIHKIDYDLNIKELAEKAHLSKFHYQRKFKKTHGLTIGQFKQQEKTIQAKALLENGKLSTDVAYELGFFDQSHFIKYFKKMWAITPKNIR